MKIYYGVITYIFNDEFGNLIGVDSYPYAWKVSNNADIPALIYESFIKYKKEHPNVSDFNYSCDELPEEWYVVV